MKKKLSCFLTAGLTLFLIGSVNAADSEAQIDYSNWMSDLIKAYPTLSDKTLKDFTLTGSHDAGMSQATICTSFATADNTQTQTLPILGQLEAGSRYFDIRPVKNVAYNNTQWYTGHYTYPATVLGATSGCTGQTIDEVIADVNAFFDSGSEDLVILHFSHGFNYNGSSFIGGKAKPLTKIDKTDLINTVTSGLSNWLYLGDANTPKNLTAIPLKKLIGRVLLVFDDIDELTNIPAGAHSSKNFPLYDDYSNSNNIGTMASDQTAKLKDVANHCDLFLFSWTLTLNTAQNIITGAHIPAPATPLRLAGAINGRWLSSELNSLYPNPQQASANYITNIIYVDDYPKNVTDQAVRINKNFITTPPLPVSPNACNVVTNNQDSGAGSLRDTIAKITATDKRPITFDNDYTIELSSPLAIKTPLVIDGTDHKVTISGQGKTGVFKISAATTLSDLTITRGVAKSSPDSTYGGGVTVTQNAAVTIENSIITRNQGISGGGVYCGYCQLTVNNSTFSNNSSSGYGGSIALEGSNTSLVMNNSTIDSNNAGGNGGGIYGAGYITKIDINNSTFFENYSNLDGGAIYVLADQGGYKPSLTINNSTIFRNSAVLSTGGAGISFNASGNLTIRNTIVAANQSVSGVAQDNSSLKQCYAPGITLASLTSTNNLIGSGNCGGTPVTLDDLSLANELYDNGGYTKTLALGPYSTAIGTGNNATCLKTDQRGIPRAHGNKACDIGAFEFQDPDSFKLTAPTTP